MTRNKELFARVADQIEQHPELYDQRYIENQNGDCGTTYCIAGWVGELEGWDIPPDLSLGLTLSESDRLFHAYWEPRADLTVPEALRLIGDGADIAEVTA